MKSVVVALVAVTSLLLLSPLPAEADEISDWNQNFYQSVLVANLSPLVTSRAAAIVQASVFDAVNGVERAYTPIHVEFNAPAGASRRAAAIQAAYAAMIKIFPTQQAALDAKREASLAGVSSESAVENSVSIKRGIEWGQTVADAVWAWRSTDGFSAVLPPFLGGSAVGQWRPTPPGNLAGAGVQFATMTPWVMQSPSQFQPAGPPTLNSAEYVADFNETKLMGRIDSATRTADQTLYSRFWNASSANYFWTQVGLNLADERHLTFSERNRLLALLNLAMADAAIGCWESKYVEVFWRPLTAIPLAATDGNPLTTEDVSWTPLLTTPNHPEYPSGHSCLSGAAGRVLANIFGDKSPFSLISDNPAMAGVVRAYPGFSVALEEVKNARIFAGIHFRTATNHGQQLGISLADYIMDNALQPIHGARRGQLKD